jgi:hypothetical protein
MTLHIEDGPDRPANEPSDEIEVTPEMADAGAEELARYTNVFDTLEAGAARIFRAMVRAAPPALNERFVTK